MSIVFSSVFMFFEAFRLTLVKKKRQNEESRENVALYRELESRGWLKEWTNQSAANKACCRSVESCDWLEKRGQSGHGKLVNNL